MKRGFVLPLVLLLLAACSNRTDDLSGDIVFLNDSHIPVSSVSVSCEGETQAGQFADGSPLRKGECLSFDMVKAPSVMVVYGQEGEELASCILTEPPEIQWKVFLKCTEDGELILTPEN